MSIKQFVHLHVHTDYSLLDGACIISRNGNDNFDLIKLIKDFKMPAVAITDHGVMGGAIEFYIKMKQNDIKPIIGCEVYIISEQEYIIKTKKHHLILLAKNYEGYKNLCKLNSIAHLEGFYYKPRINKNLLAKYSNGLIGLSACLQGEIQHFIIKNEINNAKKIIMEYVDIFGAGNFYLEIMDHRLGIQRKVNRKLIILSKELDVPLVATNDVHYLKKEHAKAHELMLCVQTNTIIPEEERNTFFDGEYSVKNDKNFIFEQNKEQLLDINNIFFKEKNIESKRRLRLSTEEFYFKNGNEMYEIFKETPQAIKNTLEIAEKCNLIIPLIPDITHYPIYDIEAKCSNTITKKEFLKNKCINNIKTKYNFDFNSDKLITKQQKVLERLFYEIDCIEKSNYCDYFLIVWDVVRYARKMKIPIGPGRGSGAGSIVAYLLEITDIDPLQYNLLFERFLNLKRISPPDFDLDFCERRRHEIIQYIKNKYGNDNVAQIGTYGTLKPKSLVKDIGRTLGFSFNERNIITKLIDNFTPISEIIENNENIKDIITKNQKIKHIFTFAEPLEGIKRHFSTHASGIIISDVKLSNLIPLGIGTNKEITSQYESTICEKLGLLKIDFLGLKTLTIIQDTLDIIVKTKNISLNINNILFNDKKTYNLINNGNTIGVFQLESNGMRDLCKKFNVKRIEDIITLIAMYRPGPMQFIPDFLDKKAGNVIPEYDHPKIKNILKETYGIMLYQEQIMQVVQLLAGFTLSQADILRRAIGKKRSNELESQKQKFIDGCKKNSQINSIKANKIWDKIKLFVGYGFNKSHSTAYAILAYRTAYLKANYPIEFMVSILNSVIDKVEDITFFIKECKRMNINILTPNINNSDIIFTVNNKDIQFGLSAIKGVGFNTSKIIIDIRNKLGKYKSIIDFTEKVGYKLTVKIWENIIRAGTLDNFNLYRSQMIEIISVLISYINEKREDLAFGQSSLFDVIINKDNINNQTNSVITIPKIPELNKIEMLNDEKTLLGFYISGHPWSNIFKYNKEIITHTITDLISSINILDNIDIKLIGGIITNIKYIKSKRQNNKFLIFILEDNEYNMIKCIIYSKLLFNLSVKNNISDLICENCVIFISGVLRNIGENNEIIVRNIDIEKTLITRKQVW